MIFRTETEEGVGINDSVNQIMRIVIINYHTVVVVVVVFYVIFQVVIIISAIFFFVACVIDDRREPIRARVAYDVTNRPRRLAAIGQIFLQLSWT